MLTETTLADEFKRRATEPVQHIDLLRAGCDSVQDGVAKLGFTQSARIMYDSCNGMSVAANLPCVKHCKIWGPFPASAVERIRG